MHEDIYEISASVPIFFHSNSVESYSIGAEKFVIAIQRARINIKGSVTRDLNSGFLVSKERYREVRAARMGPKVDRRTCTKLLTK